MKTYFVETEPNEEEFFAAALQADEPQFVSSMDRVGADAEILSVFINSPVTREFLDCHPHLKLIASRSTGHEHIDTAACEERGITVSFVYGYGDNSVAEHTFALMLALSRRTREAREASRKGRFSYETTRGIDLNGATLGVIGTGKIGLRVIRVAKAFGMTVVAHDVDERPELQEVVGFRYVPFRELLRQADIITLHAALTPESYHLMNREAFARCKRGVYIVNTARGRLIDTNALVEALDEGIVAGAGLDVIEDERVMRHDWSKIVTETIVANMRTAAAREEPRMKAPGRVQALQGLMNNATLISRPNVVFTPHTAFNSIQAVERINRVTVENIQSFQAGKPLNLRPASRAG